MNTVDPVLKDVESMTVAFMLMKGNYNQIPASFGKLYTWITENGYKPTGPALSVYFNIPGQVPDDELMWELRSRVSEDVSEIEANDEGLGIKRLCPDYVASVMYKGPYEKVEETYASLAQWIESNNYQVSGPPQELYYNSPEEVPSNELLTEIRFPVVKK